MAQPLAFPIQPSIPTTAVETVTPEVAREWLGANTKNRNVRSGAVATYARDMRDGRWMFTGEAVKFADDGTLLDGQHRLLAVIEADTAVPLMVIRGLSRASQDQMDTGRRRTTADALSLHGERNAPLLAATAKLILSDGARTRRDVSTGEINELIESETMLRTICTDIVPPLRITAATPAVLCYAYWRLDKVSPDAADAFFQSFSSLVGLPAGSPILALHRRLTTSARATRSHHYRQETLACIFLAWNAWRKNESRTIIKLAYSNGQLAIPEPR